MNVSKGFLIHGGILLLLVIFTVVSFESKKRDEIEAQKQEEAEWDGSADIDHYADVKKAKKRNQVGGGVGKVLLPLALLLGYGGFLAVRYGLPFVAERFTQEMVGSTEEVEQVRDEVTAQAAVAAGDYAEAVRLYRDEWRKEPSNRLPIWEAAKLQREKLNSPAVALMTLDEALAGYDWEADDRAFLMFRKVEIYEEDMGDEEKVVEVLKEVTEKCQATRHAANAMHKLRELEG